MNVSIHDAHTPVKPKVQWVKKNPEIEDDYDFYIAEINSMEGDVTLYFKDLQKLGDFAAMLYFKVYKIMQAQRALEEEDEREI